MQDPFFEELDIAKNVRLIEWLKTELVSHLAIIYKALHNGSESLITQAIAGMMINCYLLARRVGISFISLDRAIAIRLAELQEEDHELEKQTKDLSALAQYINRKMR